ncbi:PAS domain-containing protein [Tunturiibacter empetritectus]|uniref:PAS fold-3 domain-containing protein n=2 Tax=Tunturiibacter empetritectus TaxID=3069691 RepID=A0A7W8ILZ4_9BACT|nr:hypothetical protein [Edaphobacter lichenicola]
MYGFDPSQGSIPFQSFYGTILPEDEQAVRAKLEGAISAREDYDVEFRIRRTDGAISVCVASDTTAPPRKPVSTLASRWTLQTKSAPRKNAKGCDN